LPSNGRSSWRRTVECAPSQPASQRARTVSTTPSARWSVAHGLQQLEGARLDADGARLLERPAAGVDDAARRAVARQLGGQHQAGRPGADHQHVDVGRGHLVLALAQE
jgi:hypothetical protein